MQKCPVLLLIKARSYGEVPGGGWEGRSQCQCTYAAAAAKWLQSCPTLWPHRQQPTRLPRPWEPPGKNTGVGCHFLLQCMKVKMKVKSLSRVWLFVTPWTAAYQAPPSMGFPRQEWGAIAFSRPVPMRPLQMLGGWVMTFPGTRLQFTWPRSHVQFMF